MSKKEMLNYISKNYNELRAAFNEFCEEHQLPNTQSNFYEFCGDLYSVEL